ncbi:MAG: phosphoribosyltransferase family protein [Candidatus Poribacteria bacterium]|nr:phosphoribosyltransferase family protein [Candidatus Poribacteria bacterium]
MSELIVYTREVEIESDWVVEYEVYCAGKYESTLRDDIIGFKYKGQRHLGRIFGEYIYKNLPEACDLSVYNYLLPIPSKPSSISRRSYDHVRLIGERFSELCELPLAINILEALECPTQMGLSRVDRRENIKDKFRLIDPYYAEGKSFLVLDDVFTTGSTLDEVIRTLNIVPTEQLDAVVLAEVPFWY